MINEELRNEICAISPESVLFDNPSFDNSIVGLSTNGSVIYLLELMIQELSKDDNISYDEALEFIEYNTLRALPYIGDELISPTIMDDDVVWEEFGKNILKEIV